MKTGTGSRDKNSCYSPVEDSLNFGAMRQGRPIAAAGAEVYEGFGARAAALQRAPTPNEIACVL